MINGIAASRGIGIGSICVIAEHDLAFENKKIEDAEAEKGRFDKAVEEFKEDFIAQKAASLVLESATVVSADLYVK